MESCVTVVTVQTVHDHSPADFEWHLSINMNLLAGIRTMNRHMFFLQSVECYSLRKISPWRITRCNSVSSNMSGQRRSMCRMSRTPLPTHPFPVSPPVGLPQQKCNFWSGWSNVKNEILFSINLPLSVPNPWICFALLPADTTSCRRDLRLVHVIFLCTSAYRALCLNCLM